MFRVEMLPAGYGDCLWIEYGDSKKPFRILIDGGTLPTYKVLRDRIKEMKGDRHFELFIITHIDNDHIDGAVRLLNSPSLKVTYGDVWFNGWKHLPASDKLGPMQGEYVSALLTKTKQPWNKAFRGKAAVVPPAGALPSFKLPGEMRLTLLSPTSRELVNLRKDWKKVIEEAGLVPGSKRKILKKLKEQKRYKDLLGAAVNISRLAETKTPVDRAAANGSSIVVLAEYKNVRCLFAADAFPDVLAASIQRWLAANGESRLKLAAYKVAHHGSCHNTTADLIRLLRSPKFLFSTNGKIFHHPDPEAVARVVRDSKEPHLIFNYSTTRSKFWDRAAKRQKLDCTVELGSVKGGIVVELS